MAHLLGVQICLGGNARAGSRGDGGTTAAPGQHRTHGCKPLHRGEEDRSHSDPQKEVSGGDTEAWRWMEEIGVETPRTTDVFISLEAS